MLVILSGVAGAGKDTVKKEIVKRLEYVDTFPTVTSRPMREGDIPGITYIFVTKEKFKEMIKKLELREDKPSEEEIKLRLSRFEYEESKMEQYDYIIDNVNQEETIQKVIKIIEENIEK